MLDMNRIYNFYYIIKVMCVLDSLCANVVRSLAE